MMSTGLNLVRTGSTGDPSEPRFVREMIARLVVDMAAREWPQQWPSLHNDLLQVCHHLPRVSSSSHRLAVGITGVHRSSTPDRPRVQRLGRADRRADRQRTPLSPCQFSRRCLNRHLHGLAYRSGAGPRFGADSMPC